MKIYKIEAIKMPKEIGKFGEDTYRLMYYGDAGTIYLPNGRKINARYWYSPVLDTPYPFYTRGELVDVLTTNKFLGSDTEYKDEGILRMLKFRILISEALASAKTIEEMHGIFMRKYIFCSTSEEFYNLCMDSYSLTDSYFDYHVDMFYDRGVDNVDKDYLDYAIQPYFVVKYNDNGYMGYHTRKPIVLGLHFAAQFSTEEEALEATDENSYLTNDCGFEIIRIEGAKKEEVLPLLNIFNQK